MNSLQIKLLILIAVVLILTFAFAVFIWQQTIIVEKRALAAKQQKQRYEQDNHKSEE